MLRKVIAAIVSVGLLSAPAIDACTVTGGCTKTVLPGEPYLCLCYCSYFIGGLPADTEVGLWSCITNPNATCQDGAFLQRGDTDAFGRIGDAFAGVCGVGVGVTLCYTVRWQDSGGGYHVEVCCTNDTGCE